MSDIMITNMSATLNGVHKWEQADLLERLASDEAAIDRIKQKLNKDGRTPGISQGDLFFSRETEAYGHGKLHLKERPLKTGFMVCHVLVLSSPQFLI